MAENGDQTPGGDGANGNGSPVGDQEGPNHEKLKSLGSDELIKLVLDLRGEAANYRTRAKTAEGKLGDLNKRLSDMEDKQKTAEQKEQERLAALEAQAALATKAQPYVDHVKSRFEAELTAINDLEDTDPRKAAFTALLNRFPEDDYLGRLSAIEALRAASGGDKVPEGDERHPGEVGGGASEKSLADMLRIDPHFLKLGQMSGLVPKPKK